MFKYFGPSFLADSCNKFLFTYNFLRCSFLTFASKAQKLSQELL